MVDQISLHELKTISNNFAQELKNSQDGRKTSLTFIVHELSSSPIIGDGEIFECLVIGGTVARRALLKRNGGKIEVLQEDKKITPSIKNGEDFLALISSLLFKNINALALNFAYPIKPAFDNGKLDGILLAVTKEGGFHGLVGKQIGKEIENYVLTKRNKRIRVAVANDTVCLLTSGMEKFKPEELAAGIVGTGYNLAFFLDDTRLVNLESANFDKFPQTKEGKLVDKKSGQPGKAWFEKEVAGAYLYKHFNITIEEEGINFPNISSTEELDIISHKNIPQISQIAQDILKRSAQLVACQIAGIARFKKRNVIFNMEGSLFWKGNNYKETVKETVKQLVPEYKITFVEIENSSILGAAKLIA